jgi:hypothetical protein
VPTRGNGVGHGEQRGGVLRGLGAWCARHCAIVLVARLVALVALQATNRSHSGTYSDVGATTVTPRYVPGPTAAQVDFRTLWRAACP